MKSVLSSTFLFILITSCRISVAVVNAFPESSLVLCGNGVTEADEECDGEPCCDECKVKPVGILCRDAMWECDVPEYCTGVSGLCPTDLIDMTRCLTNPAKIGNYPSTEQDRKMQSPSMISPDARLFDFDSDNTNIETNNADDVPSVEFKCPEDDGGQMCSGNGRCIAENACLCYAGWVGFDCANLVDYMENRPGIAAARGPSEEYQQDVYFILTAFLSFVVCVSILGIIATFARVYYNRWNRGFKRF